MKLQKSIHLAVNILVHSKLRSWLTILGIVIGVAAIVAIVSIGEGAQASVKERLGGLGADLLTISPGSSRAVGGFMMGGGPPGERGGTRTSTTGSTTTKKNITERDVQLIKSVDGVLFVNGVVSGKADLTYLAETASVSVQGVDTLAWKNIITTNLDSGRFLDPGDTNAVVVGSRIASKSTFKQPLAVNRMITVGGRAFKIVGILNASGGTDGNDNAVFMPISAARDVLGRNGDMFNSITVKVSSPEVVDQVMADMDAKLMILRHVTDRTKDYSITSSKAMQESIASVTQTFTVFLAAIAAVSLLVGAVGITNTMFTSVLEKTRDIGIMKAIGAKNSDIMAIFLLNSGLVGLVGGLIGVMLGSGISVMLPDILSRGMMPGMGGPGGGSLRTVVPTSLLVIALSLSVLIGMVAGAVPAYNASKLRPVDALRYE